MKPLAIFLGAMMLCVVPAAAQTDKQQPLPSPCQAEPDQDGNTGNGSARPDKQKPPPGGLTQKLAPCNGVLKPPPTGDTGLTTPAPNQGNMPVIKPGQLPPQPPKK
jgi:hypothetical protein